MCAVQCDDLKMFYLNRCVNLFSGAQEGKRTPIKIRSMLFIALGLYIYNVLIDCHLYYRFQFSIAYSLFSVIFSCGFRFFSQFNHIFFHFHHCLPESTQESGISFRCRSLLTAEFNFCLSHVATEKSEPAAL